jgi:hypothetical protein
LNSDAAPLHRRTKVRTEAPLNQKFWQLGKGAEIVRGILHYQETCITGTSILQTHTAKICAFQSVAGDGDGWGDNCWNWVMDT